MKVLEINVDDLGMGGVYSFVRNIIENCGNKLQIDIASIEPFENPKNIEDLGKKGCRVFYVGHPNKILKQFYCFSGLIKLIKQEKYQCVHIHSDVANKLFISGLACKLTGVQKIILHSHASGIEGNHRILKNIVHKICRIFLPLIGTHFVTCSNLASLWMFPSISPDRILMIKNGINLKLFKYNSIKRKKIREALHAEDCFIVGHVGRFAYQKNHKYLIDCFYKLKKRLPKAFLLLVGDGGLRKEVEEQVKSYQLDDSVCFYGISHQVSDLFQAMDVFVLPSRFEGLPLVGVEAQAAGLPVLFADTITQEAKLIDSVKFIPINEKSQEIWVNSLIELQNYQRYDTSNELNSKGFDIKQTIQTLLELYSNHK